MINRTANGFPTSQWLGLDGYTRNYMLTEGIIVYFRNLRDDLFWFISWLKCSRWLIRQFSAKLKGTCTRIGHPVSIEIAIHGSLSCTGLLALLGDKKWAAACVQMHCRLNGREITSEMKNLLISIKIRSPHQTFQMSSPFLFALCISSASFEFFKIHIEIPCNLPWIYVKPVSELCGMRWR